MQSHIRCCSWLDKEIPLVFCLILIMYSIQGCAGFESKGEVSFERSLNIKSYGYERVTAPYPVRAGESSERFEVRSGDCYWNRGWDDCLTDRERSELSEKGSYMNVGSEYWYGWSIFIPQDYPNIFPTITVLGQFFQMNHPTPPVTFHNGGGGYWLTLNQMGYRSYLLIPESEFRGQWHDIIVHAKWSVGSDGFIKIWVNGQVRAEHLGPQTTFRDPIYFKYGIYRCAISAYKEEKTVDKVPTQIVYFDEVRKGRSRESVDPSLR